MNLNTNVRARMARIATLAAAMLLGTGSALAAEPGTDTAAPAPAHDPALQQFLGTEFAVESSSIDELMPTGGRLSFVFDAKENVVRLCARNTADQRGQWRMDFAKSCGVTMTFTRGERYCTLDDVKTGNAEVLASCHRLRSRDVAMRPSREKGAVERSDMIAFLVQEPNGDTAMSILVDSPSRLTDGEGGTVIIRGVRKTGDTVIIKQ